MLNKIYRMTFRGLIKRMDERIPIQGKRDIYRPSFVGSDVNRVNLDTIILMACLDLSYQEG